LAKQKSEQFKEVMLLQLDKMGITGGAGKEALEVIEYYQLVKTLKAVHSAVVVKNTDSHDLRGGYVTFGLGRVPNERTTGLKRLG
jgi:hypothetical protein